MLTLVILMLMDVILVEQTAKGEDCHTENIIVMR